MTWPYAGAGPAVALVTYSTKPRGGVVHTLYLAEALNALGQPVHVFAMGDPEQGFFRPTEVPHTIIPAPVPAATLEDRVTQTVEVLVSGLQRASFGGCHVLHAQDCLAARAATQLRDEGAPIQVIRTVHHVDDFTTAALVECQRRSIVDPDRVLVVSEYWRRLLEQEYGVDAVVVTNGVDAQRFAGAPAAARQACRARIRDDARFLFLTVGGLEPRKNSLALVEALSAVRTETGRPPVLAVVGEHSFQDHSGYRDAVLARAAALGLEVGSDIHLLGTVADTLLPAWYQAADAFVFPSTKEGWGLAILEAMSAGLPVVASDIPVFHEYLDGQDALLVPPHDRQALAQAMLRLIVDSGLRARLVNRGREVAARYTWENCARQHVAFYRTLGEC